MGYYTFYNLDIYRDGRDKNKIKEKPTDVGDDPFNEEEWENEDDPIAVLRGFSEDARYALDENGNGSDSCKWYDHDKDLIRLSEMFPDITFKLWGEGEGSMDAWNKYYKNGKVQTCYAKVTYDPFDEDKLQDWVDPHKYKRPVKESKLNNLSHFTDFV